MGKGGHVQFVYTSSPVRDIAKNENIFLPPLPRYLERTTAFIHLMLCSVQQTTELHNSANNKSARVRFVGPTGQDE